MIGLFGGPAGAGKSTVSEAWARRRALAARVDVDDVRDLILGGRLDPQVVTVEQGAQYEVSVRAAASLVRSFATDGYDVAVEEVFPPDSVNDLWRPLLGDMPWHLVVLLPTLDVTLQRSRQRTKRVLEEHTRAQHAAVSAWPADVVVDTTGLTASESLDAVERHLAARGVA